MRIKKVDKLRLIRKTSQRNLVNRIGKIYPSSNQELGRSSSSLEITGENLFDENERRIDRLARMILSIDRPRKLNGLLIEDSTRGKVPNLKSSLMIFSISNQFFKLLKPKNLITNQQGKGYEEKEVDMTVVDILKPVIQKNDQHVPVENPLENSQGKKAEKDEKISKAEEVLELDPSFIEIPSSSSSSSKIGLEDFNLLFNKSKNPEEVQKLNNNEDDEGLIINANDSLTEPVFSKIFNSSFSVENEDNGSIKNTEKNKNRSISKNSSLNNLNNTELGSSAGQIRLSQFQSQLDWNVIDDVTNFLNSEK